MRKSWLLVGLVVGVVLFFVLRGGRSPDEKLVGHVRALCQIAERGAKSPDDGVRRFFAYHGEHGPEMLELFGKTLVEIERIKDDGAHDRRARLVRERLQKQFRACERPLNDFGEAIANDPRALARWQRGMERLQRTLDILFGQRSVSPTLTPAQLMHLWLS